MTRCDLCGVPIRDFSTHLPFAHQEEYVGELPFVLAQRSLPTDWRAGLTALASLLAVLWAGRL